uniref:Serine-threonine protein phosphatase N-terminal domain-containing protein n=1 Tax=Panagrolaimus sp. JU765 TaxID=591449 RepID=A0AC34QJ30_9BILA
MVTRRKSFIYGQIDVDSIICRLTQTEQWKRDIDVSEHEIKMVCTLARQIFLQQPMLLELNAPLKIAVALALATSLNLPTMDKLGNLFNYT